MHCAPAVQHVLQYVSADVEAHAPHQRFVGPQNATAIAVKARIERQHRCSSPKAPPYGSGPRRSADSTVPFFLSPSKNVSCNGQVQWTIVDQWGNREPKSIFQAALSRLLAGRVAAPMGVTGAAGHRLRMAAWAGPAGYPVVGTIAPYKGLAIGYATLGLEEPSCCGCHIRRGRYRGAAVHAPT